MYKRIFKTGYRRIVGIDGDFLKSATKGQMLTTIGWDAMIKCISLLGHLKEDLDINNDEPWAIQSD